MARRAPRARQTRVGAGSVALLPEAFVAAAAQWAGAEADAFLEACARPPRLAVRANLLKGDLYSLCQAIGGEAEEWPRLAWWPAALLPPREEGDRLAAGLLAHIGALYAQDPAALAAVAALDPQPGERILDLCAAPGGKSSAIADRLGNTGLLVANDVDGRRARELAHTLERWGATNAVVLSQRPERLAALAPRAFDRVLVDAPCSGEAMFARRAQAAPDWSLAHVQGCAARQRRILDEARRLVRPGGLIVYATCTFNPHENEGVIAAYLSAHPSDELEEIGATIPGAGCGRPDLLPGDRLANPGARAGTLARCARLWPHRSAGAGHFVARIGVGEADKTPVDTRRTGRCGTGRAGQRPASLPPTEAGDANAVRALVATHAPGLNAGDGRRLVVRGDLAFLMSDAAPDELVAAALVPGLVVAARRGRTWRPAHALARALRAEQAHAAARLDAGAARAFLAGQPVVGDGAGWVLATWRGYPLGWARARAGTLTPQLPGGVRLHQ